MTARPMGSSKNTRGAQAPRAHVLPIFRPASQKQTLRNGSTKWPTRHRLPRNGDRRRFADKMHRFFVLAVHIDAAAFDFFLLGAPNPPNPEGTCISALRPSAPFLVTTCEGLARLAEIFPSAPNPADRLCASRHTARTFRRSPRFPSPYNGPKRPLPTCYPVFKPGCSRTRHITCLPQPVPDRPDPHRTGPCPGPRFGR
jgi:hypothetical protein